jgi:hypothetical protein
MGNQGQLNQKIQIKISSGRLEFHNFTYPVIVHEDKENSAPLPMMQIGVSDTECLFCSPF